jgi:catechol 2,3-dioxygenase-like lactoylglutathione lyase family enzyme
MEKPLLSKMVHLGFVVKDLEKAIKDFESIGIGPFEPLLLPMIGRTVFRGKPLESKEKFVSTKTGQVEIVLTQPIEGESPWQEFLDSKGEGVHHIAYLVDDLDKEVANFKKRGFDISQIGRWEGGGGGVYLEPKMGGINIELMQKSK